MGSNPAPGDLRWPNDVRDLPAGRSDGLNRFLGGSPLAVAFRLVLLSILVGVVLAAIGFDPWNIIIQHPLAVPAAVGSRLRRGELAVALLPARRRHRDPDLAAVARLRRAARQVRHLGSPQPMQLRFVGCGDAFGSGGRLNTCFHVSGRAANFLIDCGASALPALKRLEIDRDDDRPDPDHAFPRRPFCRAAVCPARCAILAADPAADHRGPARHRDAARRK